MKALFNWLDERTGYRAVLNDALDEPVPGGARWQYVFGSMLMFAFTVQVITGLFLWTSYSPSSQTAWESVYYISFVQSGGWFLRGLHHFMAQAMVVLLALHMLQVIWAGAYRAPREVNFWLGLVLMLITLALSLTGYLLPWDQKGYWATTVATNIAGGTPLIGPEVQEVAVGGTSYGHQTLTRFFALHAGILPGLLMLFVALHLAVFRKHGVTYPKYDPKKTPDALFWPDQVLKDAVACLALLVVVVGLTMYFGPLFLDRGGAELGAPADPANEYAAARPEWYFLFLFQLLKYFESEVEILGMTVSGELLGTIIIPGAILLVLFLMPLTGRVRIGHYFNVAFMVALLGWAGYLTWEALDEDWNKPNHVAAVAYAEYEGDRARHLAMEKGIPPGGANLLLKADPQIEGPRLFAKKCAICHRLNGHDGKLIVPEVNMAENASEEDKKAILPSAADLGGYASREWLTGLLDPKQTLDHYYYGGRKTPEGEDIKDNEMVDFVLNTVATYDKDQQQQLADAIVALSAEAKLPYQKDMDQKDQERIARGWKYLVGDQGSLGCADCHSFDGEGGYGAPDLKDYGSHQWVADLTHDISQEKYFGDRNEVGGMPLFGEDDLLEPEQIDLIVQWLRSVKMEIQTGLQPIEKSNKAIQWIHNRHEQLHSLAEADTSEASESTGESAPNSQKAAE